MANVIGVCLLPSTGEFAYDTVPHNGAQLAGANGPINTFFAPGGTRTDYSLSLIHI